MHSSTRALQSRLLAHLDTPGLSPDRRAVVTKSMEASFSVHDGQLRPGGIPYPDHPLTVALRMVEAGAAPSPSHLVAALLHDAVEDAHGALVSFLKGDGFGDGATREDAFRAISEELDPRAAEWIRALTNPDFDAVLGDVPESERTAQKNALYCAHLVGIIDHAPDAFLVKFEDFSENALSLAGLEDGPRRQKLRAKYGPAVRALRDRLTSLADASHVLAPHRARMLDALESALATEYASH